MNRILGFLVSKLCGKPAPTLVLAAIFALLTAATADLAHAQTFTDLYNFGTASTDPVTPQNPGLIAQGLDGNLYSTSPIGGALNQGSVFKITPGGALSIIYSFDGVVGLLPYGGLTLGTDGNFYGTAQQGGSSGGGIIFQITPAGNLTVLYQFTGAAPDGKFPDAAPIEATDGNFYGTALYGGTAGDGSVYKLTPSGVLTTLHSFKGGDGKFPIAPLVQGTDGNIYGTTSSGGKLKWGTVFRISTTGKFKVLYNFDITHGQDISAPLIQGTDGNLYGTAQSGGTNTDGTIFSITPAGVLTVLHNFTGFDGYLPYAGLVQASDGNFYGVTTGYGPSGFGSVFSITPQGTFSTLYSGFNSFTGEEPEVTLLQHTNGLLYGDTFTGGTGSLCTCGTFYSLNSSLPPFAGLVSSSGRVGLTVGILGQGFTGSGGISFNGTAATNFAIVSDTYATAQVPVGATNGLVVVNTPGGPLISKQEFRVIPAKITSFSPHSGPVGTQVILTGVSLTDTSKVTFGGVAATTFVVNSDTQVTVTVPTGAKTGRIVITTPGGTAASGTFTVT